MSIFNLAYQNVIEDKINDLKENDYSLENPLIIYNQYGTASMSYYVYLGDGYDDLSYEIQTEGYTDKDGKIIIDDIPIGKYYLIESEAPKGYILNTEKQFFEITEDGQIIKSTMTNEKEVEVPNTGVNAIDITYVLGGLAILGGIRSARL